MAAGLRALGTDEDSVQTATQGALRAILGGKLLVPIIRPRIVLHSPRDEVEFGIIQSAVAFGHCDLPSKLSLYVSDIELEASRCLTRLTLADGDAAFGEKAHDGPFPRAGSRGAARRRRRWQHLY